MDLTGKTYGRWSIIKPVPPHYSKGGVKKPFWLCQCQCGTIKEVSQTTLNTGKSLSCGCLQRETAKKISISYRKKYNPYVIHDSFVILYTFKNEPFLVDIEDFGRIRNYCWRKSDNDYIITTINHHTVFLQCVVQNLSQ